jgi:hypothetical protein
MLTKSFALILAAIVCVVAIGGSWGVSALTSSHSAVVPSSTSTGSPGTTGTSGSNGEAGANGSAGSTGATGAKGANGSAGTTGATGTTGASGATGSPGTPGAGGTTGAIGPQGPTGLTGPQGIQGPVGASGASAPTFSAISASGLSSPGPVFAFFTQTAAVPAGPALVGFSVGLSSPFGLGFPVTCSLVDTSNPSTVFATTASLTPGLPPAFSTYAATQVVDLAAPTVLSVQCVMTPSFPPPLQYQSLSVYAISFAS